MTQALLLMDLQTDIVARFGGDAPDYIDRVSAVRERAERAGLLVVLVQVCFAPGHPEISSRNRTFAQARDAGRMQAGDPGVELQPGLRRDESTVVVTKKRVSAFAGSDLELVLRAHDVTGLVLAGIATSGVVLSTLREAADKDYELTVLEDLCLDADPEVHDVLMHKVFPRQADVIRSADWLT